MKKNLKNEQIATERLTSDRKVERFLYGITEEKKQLSLLEGFVLYNYFLKRKIFDTETKTKNKKIQEKSYSDYFQMFDELIEMLTGGKKESAIQFLEKMKDEIYLENVLTFLKREHGDNELSKYTENKGSPNIKGVKEYEKNLLNDGKNICYDISCHLDSCTGLVFMIADEYIHNCTVDKIRNIGYDPNSENRDIVNMSTALVSIIDYFLQSTEKSIFEISMRISERLFDLEKNISLNNAEDVRLLKLFLYIAEEIYFVQIMCINTFKIRLNYDKKTTQKIIESNGNNQILIDKNQVENEIENINLFYTCQKSIKDLREQLERVELSIFGKAFSEYSKLVIPPQMPILASAFKKKIMNNFPFGMTKKGYKDKFMKTFLTLSIGGYFLFLIFLGGVSGVGEFVFGYFLVVYYTFIPSAIIALIWEFFEEK